MRQLFSVVSQEDREHAVSMVMELYDPLTHDVAASRGAARVRVARATLTEASALPTVMERGFEGSRLVVVRTRDLDNPEVDAVVFAFEQVKTDVIRNKVNTKCAYLLDASGQEVACVTVGDPLGPPFNQTAVMCALYKMKAWGELQMTCSHMDGQRLSAFVVG